MCEDACNTCSIIMPYELLVIHSFLCDKLKLEAVYLEALNISKSRDGSRSHHWDQSGSRRCWTWDFSHGPSSPSISDSEARLEWLRWLKGKKKGEFLGFKASFFNFLMFFDPKELDSLRPHMWVEVIIDATSIVLGLDLVVLSDKHIWFQVDDVLLGRLYEVRNTAVIYSGSMMIPWSLKNVCYVVCYGLQW